MKKGISLNQEMIGENCNKKRRHLSDSHSYLPWVISSETPSGLFSLFFLLWKRNRREGQGNEAIGDLFGLSAQCLGWMSERGRGREGKRERDKRWGRVVVGKGVKKKERCVHFLSSLLGGSRQWISPWSHLVAHCLVTAKCVKTPPTKR